MASCQGQQLIALGTAIAFQLAQCLSADDLELVGSLLEVVGDQLALLALTKPSSTATPPCPLPPSEKA